jgi:ATP-dependent DNA ligase
VPERVCQSEPVTLPLAPVLPPQLARPAKALPEDGGWWFEPKWDGFRAVVFVDGDDVVIQSRNGRPLGRYFPELVLPPGRYVLDGEIVVPAGGGEGQDFDALQQRIHPAASRVRLLAESTPAVLYAFDLLVDGDEVLLERPFAERRRLLEERVGDPVRLTPGTASAADAARWLREAEGVIAKRMDAPYRPGERVGMLKVRRTRTIDCVVVGWRPGTTPDTVGSLILGLYEGDALRVVGHSAGFRAAQKRELRELVRPYETGGRGTGDPSRWSTDRELEWVEMRPELVVEVSFDHASNGRIRHGARLLRVRHDRDARSCDHAQLSG